MAAGPGPVRVIAGPGTGKTEVIVERFRRLVADGADPASILVMTFTERAAGEMRARIEAATGWEGPLAVGTFHAQAQSWLRQDGPRAGVPERFGVLAGPDRWILAWELMWRLADPLLVGAEHPELQVTPLLRMLERLKEELIPVARLEAWARRAPDDEHAATWLAACRLYRAYARECRRLRLLDFDDLLERAVALLSRHPDVLARYRARFPWVLVDEYQDTNLAQERIVELLGQSGQVFVVGDDDQSIYRFRGASRASMERFARAFPATLTTGLTQNRRSTPRIAAAAAALVEHNADRLPKDVRSVRRGGPPVSVWQCDDGEDEAAAIAAEIGRLRGQGVPLDAVAVLTRTNAVAAPLAAALEAAGLAVRTSGWWRFFDRPAVKDLLAALMEIREPSDQVAAERLAGGFGRLDRRAWLRLRASVAEQARHLGVGDLFFELMSASGYLEEQRGRRAAEAMRFGDLVADFVERSADQSLAAFLDRIELVRLSGLDVDLPEPEEPAEPAVSVMTIHQAKGLEFDAVFVPALVDGRLPQPPRRERLRLPSEVLEPAVRGREDHLAEERRLLYVAMTRARTHLYLSWAARYEGGRRWRPSPFLAELGAAAGEVEVIASAPATGEPVRRPPASPARSTDLVLSYSALATYRDCPKRYWYRYERALPGPRTAETHLGNAIHRALMKAAERALAGEQVLVAEAARLLGEAWVAEPFPEPRREPVFRKLAEGMLSAYLEAGGLDRPLLHVEHPFSVAMDGWTLRGVIDRVDGPAAGGEPHVLVDYKTGAALPASRLRRDFQLALYALGAKRALQLDRLELELAYLRDGVRVRVPAGEELLAEAEQIAGEAVDQIRAGDFNPQPEFRRCRSCPYRLACDAAL